VFLMLLIVSPFRSEVSLDMPLRYGRPGVAASAGTLNCLREEADVNVRENTYAAAPGCVFPPMRPGALRANVETMSLLTSRPHADRAVRRHPQPVSGTAGRAVVVIGGGMLVTAVAAVLRLPVAVRLAPLMGVVLLVGDSWKQSSPATAADLSSSCSPPSSSFRRFR
jgi:hypothetical protein